jgi:phage shock protein A
MGQTIWQKLSLIVRGNIHEALNKVVDLNSPAAVAQNIRDLEAYSERMEQALTKTEGDKNDLRRQLYMLQAQMEKNTGYARAILEDNNPSNDHLAKQLVQRNVQIKPRIASLETQVAEMTEVTAALTDTIGKLRSKREVLGMRLNELQTMDYTASAKMGAANALRDAERFLGEESVDNLQGRAHRRASEADAALKYQLEKSASLQDQAADAILVTEVEDEFARLQAEAQQNKLLREGRRP